MTLVPSVTGPREKNSEGESPDFDSLWIQLNGLSALLSELSKELDDKAPQVTSDLIEGVCEGVVDPEKDWKIKLGSLPLRSTLEEKIREHYLASHRQLFYFEILFNKNRSIGQNRLKPNEEKQFLSDFFAKLSICISWGYWHYHVALSTLAIQKKTARKKGSKAGRAKSDDRKDSETVLRALIRGRLVVRPPGGWSYLYDASKKIAASIEPVLNDFKINIPERGEDLAHRVDIMIRGDSALKGIYEENR